MSPRIKVLRASLDMFTRRLPFPGPNPMFLELSLEAVDPIAMVAPAPPAAPRSAREPVPAVAPSPPNVVLDERTLCERALRGDEEAWNALVAKHDHRVVVSLLARGVRVDRARDIAQEAWIRLVEQQRAGRLTHLQLPGLAIAQAAFLSLEAARRDGSRGEPLSIHGDDARTALDVADPAADAETRMLTTERIDRAERVLAECSPSARKVFRLAYGGDGLSHAEVAKSVGLSLQRVRQILCEVRAKLRVAFDGEMT
jgi:RNA polymerase sigma factor (sigma-70 family)